MALHSPTSLKALINLASQGNLGALGQLLYSLVMGETYIAYAGSPVGNVTPEAGSLRGQWCFDTTNGIWYRSTGTANTNWTQVGGNGGLVAAGATLTLTKAAHDRKTILLDTAAGSVVTLPAASGSGAKFEFVVKTTATSNNHKVQVANASDIMQGIVMGMSDDPATVKGWEAGASDDTITMNRTTTGTAKVGHRLVLEDIATNVWAISGWIAQNGTEATPFSAAV